MGMQYYGYNPPFFGGHQNVMSRQSGDRLIKNDILQLLLTGKGERVMRPTWGTVVSRSLFEQMDDTLASSLIQDIDEQLRTYEPRIQATVGVVAEKDNNLLRISVSGILTNEPNQTFELELELPFDRSGE